MQSKSFNSSSPTKTTAINSKVEKLRITFHAFAKKSAKCVLGMAETVTKAKRLSPAEFANFCDLVGLDPMSSRIRKLIVIGNNVDKLKKHLKALPPNWTTIYEIAQMDEDLIDRLVDKGDLTPAATASSLSPSKPSGRSKPLKSANRASSSVPNGTHSPESLDEFLELDGSEVVAHFDGWLEAERLRVLTSACNALRSIGAEVHLGSCIEEMIECAAIERNSSTTVEIEHAGV